jgi:magnesium transporter
VIRALALGEVGVRDWWRVMRREIWQAWRSGDPRQHRLSAHHAVVGVLRYLRPALAARGGHRVGVAGRRRALGHAQRIAAAVSAEASRLRSGGVVAPFVATLVDVTGLVIYFSVALVVLRGTLL